MLRPGVIFVEVVLLCEGFGIGCVGMWLGVLQVVSGRIKERTMRDPN